MILVHVDQGRNLRPVTEPKEANEFGKKGLNQD
jgi:hypothetical protein